MTKAKREVKIGHMSKKIDIICLYTGNCNARFGVREIARKLKVNPQTVLNHLNLLVKENVLTYQRKGRNKEFSLNIENMNTKLLIDLAEIYKGYVFLSNNPRIKTILQEIKKFSDTIVVFGSYAKGTYDEHSDLDLVIFGKADTKSIGKIKDNYTLEINIQYVTFDEFNDLLRKGKGLAIEILNNHLILGNIPRLTDIFWRYFDERR